MGFSELILKRKFWILFIITVLISLFVYGLLIYNANSEQSKTKNDLESIQSRITEYELLVENNNREISHLKTELLQKNKVISSLNDELNNNERGSKTKSDISRKNEIISSLNSELNKKNKEISNLNSELTNKNNEISILNSNIIKREANKTEANYQTERASTSHRFGNGKSKITIYTICRNARAIKILIDGNYSGTLTKYYINDSPDCSDSEKGFVVNSIVQAGKHQISAKSEDRRSWSFEIFVREDECKTIRLKCGK